MRTRPLTEAESKALSRALERYYLDCQEDHDQEQTRVANRLAIVAARGQFRLVKDRVKRPDL